jgi:hypothetical protein
MRWLNIIGRWLAAVAVTVVGVSAAHSWRVQSGLIALGVEIPPPLRLQTALADFIGLAPALFVVLGVAIAIGMLAAAALRGRLKIADNLAFPLGGAASIAVTLLVMYWQMNMTPLAGARDLSGFAMFCAAGALGGLVFARTAPRRLR